MVDGAAGHRHHIVLTARNCIAGGTRRLLAAGALAEDIAQPEKDEDREGQEDDGVNIHVVFAFWSMPRALRTSAALNREPLGQ